MVDGAVAATSALIMSMKVKDVLKFKKSFLRKLRPEMEGDRDGWERFVVIQGGWPRRHEHVPSPASRGHGSRRPPLQLAQTLPQGRDQHVRRARNGQTTVKYVEQAGNHLVLRPHNQAYPVEVMAMEEGKNSRRLPGRPHLLRGNRNLAPDVEFRFAFPACASGLSSERSKTSECRSEAMKQLVILSGYDIGSTDRVGARRASDFTSARPSCRQVAAAGHRGQETRNS